MKKKLSKVFAAFTLKSSMLLIALITVTLIFSIQSCKREISIENPVFSIDIQKQKVHQEKVETWMKLIPFDGHLNQTVSEKTIQFENNIITALTVGKNGNSFYFITANNKFHAYGINSSKLKLNQSYNGEVLVYDFQNLKKNKLEYKADKLVKFIKYGDEKVIMNAYYNIYPSYIKENITIETVGIVNKIRKFFCELFGGSWSDNLILPLGGAGYCNSGGGSDGQEEVQNVIASDGGGGGYDIGNLLALLNNPNVFDINDPIWYSVFPWLSAGGGSNGTTWIGNTMPIDPDCPNPQLIRDLFFTLEVKENQQPATIWNGTLTEMLDQYQIYSNSEQVAIPIIPILLKALANGGADALTQALFIYLTEDNCPSYGAAFGHSTFSKAQVARSAAEGALYFWKIPGGKLGKAAYTALGDILVNAIEGKYANENYKQMGNDFMAGFFSDLAGGAVGDLATKYRLGKIGKGLIKKFNVPYYKATSWLGGGLQNISKTLNVTLPNGTISSITSDKVMKGWDPTKVAVIGRDQNLRVAPFASKLSAELGVTVHQIKQWSGWSNNLTVEQNKQWIQKLKEEGYTIYDIGTGPMSNDKGEYYSMEHLEIFGN